MMMVVVLLLLKSALPSDAADDARKPPMGWRYGRMPCPLLCVSCLRDVTGWRAASLASSATAGWPAGWPAAGGLLLVWPLLLFCDAATLLLQTQTQYGTDTDNVMAAAADVFGRSWNLFEGDVSQALLLEQVHGLVRVRHDGLSLRDLGYKTIGLDDGWQDCSSGNGYHDPKTGVPRINAKFPDMLAMTTAAKAKNVSMGWYGNNCGCHGKDDVDRYRQDAEATVKLGYRGTKIDSCGPETNISAWREALDAASKAYGDGSRIVIENCRNYAFTQELTKESDCEFELFRSTEDNAPHFASIMHNLMTNAEKPGAGGNVHGGLPVAHRACWSYAGMQCRRHLLIPSWQQLPDSLISSCAWLICSASMLQ